MSEKEQWTDEQKDEWNLLVLEIMMLGFAIDRHTPYCVFVDYSGHVENLRVEIRKSKEQYTVDVVLTEMYIEGEYATGDPLAYYKKKRDILKGILEAGEVDTSAFEEIRSTVIDYAF